MKAPDDRMHARGLPRMRESWDRLPDLVQFLIVAGGALVVLAILGLLGVRAPWDS